MDLIYITSDIYRARIADKAGVARIMVDLELDGKFKRQGHLNTVISQHTIEDVARIKKNITKSKLMVRVNPFSSNSRDEIESCLNFGAEILMLPMFRCIKEIESFLRIVNGRAHTSLLLETSTAFVRLDRILRINEVQEIHIGLNDLHLELKLPFMFELLSSGIVEYMANRISSASGVRFGFGGVGRINKGILLSNLILSEHVRLKSNQVIMSRDFNSIFIEETKENGALVFEREVRSLLNYIIYLSKMKDSNLIENKLLMIKKVNEISDNLI
jgi:hypothetical protein